MANGDEDEYGEMRELRVFIHDSKRTLILVLVYVSLLLFSFLPSFPFLLEYTENKGGKEQGEGRRN
jgi:hypothetical protein